MLGQLFRRCAAAAITCLLVTPALVAQWEGVDPTDPESPGFFAPSFGPYFNPFISAPAYSFDRAYGAPSRSALDVASAANELSSTFPKVANELVKDLAAERSLREDPSLTTNVKINPDINHQPLIHIKVRVIEVQRADELAVASVLEYVGGGNTKSSLVSGRNLNGKFQNNRGITRFGVPGLVGIEEMTTNNMTVPVVNDGAGLLVNLTSKHIDYLASLLATELNGDVITSPQVTTLNGKNVIFRSGDKVPFVLGRVVATGGSTDIETLEQFFYKHVGTYISVTPQIVNWGPNHEGRGRVRASYEDPANLELAPIQAYDIEQGNVTALLTALRADSDLPALTSPNFQTILTELPTPTPLDDIATPQAQYEETVRRTIDQLNALLGYTYRGADGVTVTLTRSVLAAKLQGTLAVPYIQPCNDCDWRPEDCTINLNIAVRLSNAGGVLSGAGATDTDVITGALDERDVRAISNVVQVKSGYGVVMGGLISLRDDEVVSKVPVLGDLPIAGFLFRSKQTQKAKTETIIFVEAEVLPDNSAGALAVTEQDFCNGKQHLDCDICNTDLHLGLARAGLATGYLPYPSPAETAYWHHYHRQMCLKNCRQMRSQVREATE
jgi:Flp pilus assembly secretin CpaC